jgi:phosphoribosylformylglycinamidine synthase
VLGVIDDVTRRTPVGFLTEGQQIYLLGATADELDGSEWAHVVHGHLGGVRPQLDLAAEHELADILVNASRDGLIDAAHDLSDGGLAQALVESCLRHGVGARSGSRTRSTRSWRCFGVDGPRDRGGAAQRGGAVHRHVHGPRLPARADRVTDGLGQDAVLDVQDQFVVPLSELRAAWSAPCRPPSPDSVPLVSSGRNDRRRVSGGRAGAPSR